MTDLLAGVDRSPRRLEVRLADEALRRFAPEPFFAEYDPLVDLEALPDEAVLVPFLLNLAPVVWATGGVYEVARIDARLAASLTELRTALRGLYPELPWSGEIVARTHARSDDPDERDGRPVQRRIDSIYTAIVDPAPHKLLVTVCGSDIAVDNEVGWAERPRAGGRVLAQAHGHRAATVRSNFFTFLNKPQLNYLVPSIPDWWAYVQHGMGLAGLTAPILAAAGCSRLLIAATTPRPTRPRVGSSPKIDDLIAWDGVSVVHHGFEASCARTSSARSSTRRAAPDSARRCCGSATSDPTGSVATAASARSALRTATGLIVEREYPRRTGSRSRRWRWRPGPRRASGGTA